MTTCLPEPLSSSNHLPSSPLVTGKPPRLPLFPFGHSVSKQQQQLHPLSGVAQQAESRLFCNHQLCGGYSCPAGSIYSKNTSRPIRGNGRSYRRRSFWLPVSRQLSETGFGGTSCHSPVARMGKSWKPSRAAGLRRRISALCCACSAQRWKTVSR